MKKLYEFNEAKHVHSLGGKRLYGVTTVLGVISKPSLIQWSANQAVEYIQKNWEVYIATGTPTTDLFIEAKTAHRRTKEAAGDIGTTAHQAIEKWIKSGCDVNVPIAIFCGYDKQIQEMFMNFVEWVQSNNVTFLGSEKNVYSEKMWLGGIVDFICTIDGKRYVGDIKTSSGIYPEHFLQCGAYDLMLEEMGDPKAEGYIVVNIRKDGKMKIKTFKRTKIFKEAFVHALELFKAMKKIDFKPY